MTIIGKHIFAAALAIASVATVSMAQTSTDAPETPVTPGPQGSPSQPPSTSADQPPSEPPEQPMPQGQRPGAQPEGTAACPDFLRGSTIKVADANGGVSVTVTTAQPANVPMLRDMVNEIADTVEQQSKAQSQTQSQTQSGASGATMPALDMTTKDISGGTQVIVRAEDKTDVETLRKQAREMATAWQSSSCARGESASG
jgi:hypothetical protein